MISLGGNGDDTAANNVHMNCKDGEKITAFVNTRWGGWTEYVYCPTGQAVVGIQTRVERNQGEGDDTALNGIRLLCSDFDG